MSWATRPKEGLQRGETVRFRLSGNSMRGRVPSGAMMTVEPIAGEVEVDDVVLCKVRGVHYLHLVKARQGDRYLIGNNIGGTNGWIGRGGIFGRLVSADP
jgi:hypothetical protein